MNTRRTCNIFDAKAKIRAWSKRKTLIAVLAAAITTGVGMPAVVYASEPVAQGDDQSVVVAAEEAVSNTASGTDSQVSAANAAAGTETAPVGLDDTKAIGSVVVVPAEPAAGAAAAGTAAENQISPAREAYVEPTSTPAADSTTVVLPDESYTVVTDEPAGGATAGTTETAEVVPASGAGESTTSEQADSLGTTIQFDYDGDGSTTQADWQTYLDDNLNEKYKSYDDEMADGDRNKAREPDTQERVNGDIRDEAIANLTDVDVANIKSYYLNNVGQATSVKGQSPWGDCWAFGAISALESAILKDRAGSYGETYNAADHVTPVLENLDDKGVDLSELYFAWLSYSANASGSQKGEGLENVAPADVRSDWKAHLYAGLQSYADELFGAWRGVANEADFPYISEALQNYLRESWSADYSYTLDEATYETYGTKPAEQTDVAQAAHVDGVFYLPSPNVVTTDAEGKRVWASHDDNADLLIKQALVKYGAVAFSYRASSDDAPYMNEEHYAQYNDTTICRTNHVATIVGWNDDIDPSWFKTDSNDVTNLKKGAWLVKNSWGSTDWYQKVFGADSIISLYGLTEDSGSGNQTGYFWLSYYDRTITDLMFFSADDGADGFDYDHNYSYDTATAQRDTPFLLRTADSGTLVANTFTADGDQVLKAVSVRTSQPNSHATVWVYLVDADDLADLDPTNDGTLVATLECDISLTGMHTVELTSPVQLWQGQRFCVVENVTSSEPTGSGTQTQSWLNLEWGLSQSAQSENSQVNSYYHSTYLANDGETFVCILTTNGYQWVTPQQLAQAILDGRVVEFGSAMVKAFTVDASQLTLTFSDVTAATDHADDIMWLARNGISTGYPDGTFRPYANVARCDMAAFLYRLAGSPEFDPATAGVSFNDVDASTPHYKEVMWLAATNISTGFGDGGFHPYADIARCDLAAFLYRLAGCPDFDEASAAVRFADVSSSTDHYREILWMASKGITTGFPDGTFRPYDTIKRCDMAALMRRQRGKGLVRYDLGYSTGSVRIVAMLEDGTPVGTGMTIRPASMGEGDSGHYVDMDVNTGVFKQYDVPVRSYWLLFAGVEEYPYSGVSESYVTDMDEDASVWYVNGMPVCSYAEWLAAFGEDDHPFVFDVNTNRTTELKLVVKRKS